MKKRIFVFLAIFIGLLWFCHIGVQAKTQDIENKINTAKNIMSNKASSKEDFKPALFQLLDVAVSIMPKSEYSDEFIRKIEVAKNKFDENFFNEKGRQYLSMAYRIVNSGKKFQTPEELETFRTDAELMANAKKIIEGLFESAISNYQSGNNEQAVKSLLEVVILVVTPISG